LPQSWIGKKGNLFGTPEGKTIVPISVHKSMNKAFAGKAFLTQLWSI